MLCNGMILTEACTENSTLGASEYGCRCTGVSSKTGANRTCWMTLSSLHHNVACTGSLVNMTIKKCCAYMLNCNSNVVLNMEMVPKVTFCRQKQGQQLMTSQQQQISQS